MQLLILVLLALSCVSAFGQTNNTIRTGRPGHSIGPYVVGKSIFQVQSGISIEDERVREARVLNNVVRFGFSEKIEVSGVFDYKSIDSSEEDLDNLQLGLRYNVIDNKNLFIRGLGIQIRNRFRGCGEFERENSSQLLISAIKLPPFKEFSFVVNLNLAKDEADSRLQEGYTFNISYDVSEKLSFFIEPYGVAKDGLATNSINTGIGYLYHKDIAFDFSIGQDMSAGSTLRYISTGVSFRNSLL